MKFPKFEVFGLLYLKLMISAAFFFLDYIPIWNLGGALSFRRAGNFFFDNKGLGGAKARLMSGLEGNSGIRNKSISCIVQRICHARSLPATNYTPTKSCRYDERNCMSKRFSACYVRVRLRDVLTQIVGRPTIG